MAIVAADLLVRNGVLARIEALADGTRSPLEIAHALGVQVNHVYGVLHVLRAAGAIPRTARKRTASDEQKATQRHQEKMIVEGLSAGKTLAEIALDLGVTKQRVSQIVRQAGLRPTRARKAASRARAKVKSEMARAADKQARETVINQGIEKGVEMVRAGSSILAAEHALDLPRGRLNRHLRTIGIESQHGRWRRSTASAREN